MPLSQRFREAVFAEETAEQPLALVTISHASMAQPIRVVNDSEGQNLTSRGDLFVAYPFEIVLASEGEETGSARLKLDNVDRIIIGSLRALLDPPTVTIELVLRSQPDTVEAGPFRFLWRAAQYDVQTIEGELLFDEELKRFPAYDFTPGTAPGLF
jgi:hypothetical protein